MENREVSCCFSGHRIIPAAEYDNVSYQLELKVIDLIGQGVSRFFAGGALGFGLFVSKRIKNISFC